MGDDPNIDLLAFLETMALYDIIGGIIE
jgi:hypothetical protein